MPNPPRRTLFLITILAIAVYHYLSPRKPSIPNRQTPSQPQEMGNLCGKPSSTSNTANDPFSGPGRTLGSAPARGENPRAAVPAAQKISSSKGGQTLGGGAMNGSQGGGERGEPTSAAARAAEARNSQKPKGKLGKELERQKAQTVSDSLNEATREERRRREVDGIEERRNFN